MRSNPLGILALAFLACGCAPADEAYGVEYGDQQANLFVKSSHIWKPAGSCSGAAIPVCWENPSPQDDVQRGWVRDSIAKTWESVSAVKFTEWADCTAGSNGIRIRIADEWPRVFGLGNSLDGLVGGMVLNFTFQLTKEFQSCNNDKSRESCIRAIAAHEFGHALGFAHEQNRPDTPPECDDVKGENGDKTIGPWDINSIMNYCNPAWNNNGKLSQIDTRGVQIVYGVAPIWNVSCATPIRGDFNGDGKSDVAFHGCGWSPMPTLMSSGDGTFICHQYGDPAFGASNSDSVWNMSCATAIPGDFNGDGKTDVAFRGCGWASMPTYLSSGNGSFVYSQYGDPAFGASNSDSVWNMSCATAIPGDFNGDGKTDVAFRGCGWGSTPMYRSHGDGSFVYTQSSVP